MTRTARGLTSGLLLAATCLLPALGQAPASAKPMMGGKMMGGKMMGGKMSHGRMMRMTMSDKMKMNHMMRGMSSRDKRAMMGMSMREKMATMHMMKMHGMM